MSQTVENFFAKLAGIDVGERIEVKGKFSYLSWAWAVDQLRRQDPEATWEVVRFEGKPFMSTECGYFVEVAVTCKGVTLSQIHPVLDNNNRPIAQPSSFQINTSIQRCLVKAIALHGLGLYIYAGEDLPMVEGDEDPNKQAGKTSTSPPPKREQPIAESSTKSPPTPESSSIPAALKAKYQLGKGSLNGFEAWVEKMKQKGLTYPQMEGILQEALDQIKKPGA